MIGLGLMTQVCATAVSTHCKTCVRKPVRPPHAALHRVSLSRYIEYIRTTVSEYRKHSGGTKTSPPLHRKTSRRARQRPAWGPRGSQTGVRYSYGQKSCEKAKCGCGPHTGCGLYGAQAESICVKLRPSRSKRVARRVRPELEVPGRQGGGSVVTISLNQTLV